MKRRTFISGMGLGAGVVVAQGYGVRVRSDAGAILLENFPLHKQETPYTCGPAALRMVLEYFGHPLPEKDIAKTMKTNSHTGTSQWGMNHAANKYLKEFNLGLAAHDKIGKSATNEVIFSSLGKKRPVIFSWLVENYFEPGTLIGHYCVVIGFDKGAREFTIANPFGRFDKIDFDLFWRLAGWRPRAGDIPNVTKQSNYPKLPPDLLVLE
jgi:hypothetical protein